MVFNSLTFIVFFAAVLGLHSLPFTWRQKKLNLLLASYLFYAAWNPPFVALLWISTVVDWYAAKRLVNSNSLRSRRFWMLTSVAANLGVLGYFKYGNFLLTNFEALAGALGFAFHPLKNDVILPIGISFYTFATMSYTLDVYLKRAAPTQKFLDFALFVTFFPHLVAGPIMRPTELVPQFEKPKAASSQQLCFGLALMTLGLFEKVVMADGFLAPAAELIYDGRASPGILDAWIATLAFSGQIFCDFAGYSTTAIGAAMCLGFALPDNFRYPYAAIGFSDFWSRWHITLSAYLRDYVYIPLGGNRHGPNRTYVNLMATMLLGGLWHGASWTFVAWGGLHGLYLAAERMLRGRFSLYQPGTVAAVGLGLLTFVLVDVTWVFFRSKTFEQASSVLMGMVGLNATAKPILAGVHVLSVILIILGLLGAHWYLRDRTLERAVAKVSPVLISVVWGLMAFAVLVEQGAGNAFIYFRF